MKVFVGRYNRGELSNIILKPMSSDSGKKGKPLAEQIKQWKEEREALLPYGVDLYKTPKYVDAALGELKAATDVKADKPTIQEQQFIKHASRGGLIWGTPCEGEMTVLDVNSMYPWLLSRKDSQGWPVKNGEWKCLKGKQEGKRGPYWLYGIYHVEADSVPKPERKLGVPLYRWFKNGVYTHFDLELIEKVTGVVPKLAAGVNALVWEGKRRMTGPRWFGKYVDKWYALKRDGVPGAKSILTPIWGMLCKRTDKTRVVKDGDTIDEGEPDTFVPGPNPGTLTVRIVQDKKSGALFEGEAPQIAPFLTSLARKELAEMILEHGPEHVRRTHTDAFTTTLPADQWPEATKKRLGTGLGQLKIDKIVHSVVNANVQR